MDNTRKRSSDNQSPIKNKIEKLNNEQRFLELLNNIKKNIEKEEKKTYRKRSTSIHDFRLQNVTPSYDQLFRMYLFGTKQRNEYILNLEKELCKFYECTENHHNCGKMEKQQINRVILPFDMKKFKKAQTIKFFEEETCIICTVNPPTVFHYGCRHCYICYGCARNNKTRRTLVLLYGSDKEIEEQGPMRCAMCNLHKGEYQRIKSMNHS